MTHSAESQKPFKICTKCGFAWPDRDAFLSDSNIALIGYQVDFEDLVAGLFLFDHINKNCLSALSVSVAALEDLYDGPVFESRLTGTDQCPKRCIYKDDLDPCPAKCECAFVREVIQILKRWPKKEKV